MAVKGGFFNSDNGDRKYDAEDMNEFFDGMAAEGVFSTIGDVFAVTPGSGLQVKVGSGRAWFLKSWIVNTADLYLTVPTPDLTYDRIDVIALDMDKTDLVRENTIIVIEGTPSGSPVAPTLVNSSDHLQVAIAHLDVAANATSFIQADITNKVGTVDCPFATGLIDQVDIDDLLIQWRSQFDAWMFDIETTLSQIQSGTIFDRLDELDERPYLGRNLIRNGEMQVCQGSTSYSSTGDTPSQGLYGNIADRWKLHIKSSGLWDFSRHGSGPNGETAYRMINSSAQASLAADAYFRLEQEVEAKYMGNAYHGTIDARDYTVSYNFWTNLAGTYIVELRDKANGWSISWPLVVSSTSQWLDIVHTIPGETTQYIDPLATDGLVLAFWFAAGSNYTGGGSLQNYWSPVTTNQRAYGQVNLAGAVNNEVRLTNVQLEVGSVQSKFEKISYQDELQRCQRYYEKQSCYVNAIATDTNSIFGQAPLYRSPKRTTPTYTVSVCQITYPSVLSLTNISISGIEGAVITADLVSGSITAGSLQVLTIDIISDAELY